MSGRNCSPSRAVYYNVSEKSIDSPKDSNDATTELVMQVSFNSCEVCIKSFFFQAAIDVAFRKQKSFVNNMNFGFI